MSAIEMRDVVKSYGSNDVLKGFDLHVERGEIFSLLGPNGAGKTTAVEILEGYRRADAGSVRVLGLDPAQANTALRSQIGIVLQQTTSFENSTVRETVEMFAELFPDPLSVDEVLDSVGLVEQGDQVASTMSGGQRRRLDVACGLVGRPALLFLDEPTTGLDPEARRSMWRVLEGLRERGTTVLLTTHYLDEAEALADRIAILLDGQVQEVAEPSKVGGRDAAMARVRLVPPPGAPADFADWNADGDAVWVETDTPGQLVADLTNRHGELAELTVTRPSLEDVYLEMVARHGTHSEGVS